MVKDKKCEDILFTSQGGRRHVTGKAKQRDGHPLFYITPRGEVGRVNSK